MKCGSCGGEADRLYSLFLTDSGLLFVCGRCFKMFKQFLKVYGVREYSQERVYHIMQAVIEKQQREGKWED